MVCVCDTDWLEDPRTTVTGMWSIVCIAADMRSHLQRRGQQEPIPCCRVAFSSLSCCFSVLSCCSFVNQTFLSSASPASFAFAASDSAFLMLASTSRICCSTAAMLLSSVSLQRKHRQLSARPKQTNACEGVGANLSMLGCDDLTAAT